MSDITEIRRKIEDEIQALNNVKQFSVHARHKIITSHMGRLGACIEELSSELGRDAAAKLIINQLEEGL